MAYTAIYANGSTFNMVKKFVIDSFNEIYNIDTSQLSPGSTAFDISSSKTYMLNNKKQWIQVSTGGGGGGGTSGEIISDAGSDWNQNDETQPDYIKNRPFYTGNPTENVLFNGSFVFTITGMGPMGERGVYNGVIDFSPEIGQTYQVSWDGAVYSCVGTEYNSLIALGNLSIMNFGSDTGEPFLMTCGTGSVNIYTWPAHSSHTISISMTNPAEIVKIDKKYLPDVRSDWNVNDETSLSYVKNRPFYTRDPVETILVEESTVSFADAGGVYVAEFPSTFSATVGEIYKVYWDGAAYECTCVNMGKTYVIGNLSIDDVGPDTGEPFIMGVDNGKRITIVTADTSASHTFSISGFVQEVVKIDPKYIRDMYYTTNPVETVLVEERTVAFADSGEGFYEAKFQSTFVATVGEAYKVYWDGSAYERTCVAVSGSSFLFIGNLSIIGMGPDTGEPFIIGVSNGKGTQIATTDTSSSHTISIIGFVQEVVKIDEKYLPNTVATKSDVEVAQTTAENAQTTAENAQTTAENAQSTASAKFQLMRQNTVTTTTTIGTVESSVGSVPVKGLNIAVGSTIKFTADRNVSGKTVWDSTVKEIYMKNDDGVTICLLELELLHDGETYKFTNKTTSSILSNLVIEYEKVIIPKVIYPARNEGAWLPPYLIANCLYLTKKSTNSNSATLYRITVDDSGALTATEVT